MGWALTPPNVIFDLINYDNQLVACGGITGSGSTVLKGVARWDGTSWNPIGQGTLKISPNCIQIFNGDLIVAGSISLGTIPNTKCIARWDGIQWNAMGSGLPNGAVYSMATFNGSLYIGGNFSTVDSMPIKNIARWDGSNWYPVCTISLGLSELRSIVVYNNELYIGGYFSSVNGIPVSNIAKFDGSNWSTVGGGVNGDIANMYTDSINNRLYVVGNFTYANGLTIACPSTVAYWDGSNWHPVGTNGPVLYGREVYVHKNEVYIGFNNNVLFNQNGDTLAGIVKWNGNDWIPLDRGVWNNSVQGTVYALLTYNNDLAVGGGFTTAGNTPANLIAAWGDTITSLPQQLDINAEVKIFPNPFQNTATVLLPEVYKDKLPCKFQLYQLEGKVVYETKVTTLEFVIQKKNLKNGIYSYCIFNQNGQELECGRLAIE